MEMPKIATKNALFGYFWARILKYYCHIWNQHPQICHSAVAIMSIVIMKTYLRGFPVTLYKHCMFSFTIVEPIVKFLFCFPN